MTATGNEAVSLAQLKDYATNQSAGGGEESACQVFVVTSGTSAKTAKMNDWRVLVPGGTGSTYVFLASKNFIVLHAMHFTAKPKGDMTIYHSDGGRLRSSATAYSNYPETTGYGWPIYGTPNHYTGTSQIIADLLEVTMYESTRVGIRIATANNMDGYQLNANIKVNLCVWIE